MMTPIMHPSSYTIAHHAKCGKRLLETFPASEAAKAMTHPIYVNICEEDTSAMEIVVRKNGSPMM
jgi:hypothetical protein